MVKVHYCGSELCSFLGTKMNLKEFLKWIGFTKAELDILNKLDFNINDIEIEVVEGGPDFYLDWSFMRF